MGTDAHSPLSQILAEQRAAATHLLRHPGSREARQWLDDWIAEEVLTYGTTRPGSETEKAGVRWNDNSGLRHGSGEELTRKAAQEPGGGLGAGSRYW